MRRPSFRHFGGNSGESGERKRMKIDFETVKFDGASVDLKDPRVEDLICAVHDVLEEERKFPPVSKWDRVLLMGVPVETIREYLWEYDRCE